MCVREGEREKGGGGRKRERERKDTTIQECTPEKLKGILYRVWEEERMCPFI
jgi:hypothetical protein